MRLGSVMLRLLAVAFASVTGVLLWLLTPVALLLLTSTGSSFLPGIEWVFLALISCAIGLPALGAAYSWWVARYLESPPASTSASSFWDQQREPSRVVELGTQVAEGQRNSEHGDAHVKAASDVRGRQREPSRVVEFSARVAGGRRCSDVRESYIKANCQIGDEVQLVRDTDNDFNADAIAVFHCGHHIGFLPTEQTWKLAAQIDNGEVKVKGCITEISDRGETQSMQIVTVLVTRRCY